FFNLPAPTDIYTLSLHDALPISPPLSPPFSHTTPLYCERDGRDSGTPAIQSTHITECQALTLGSGTTLKVPLQRVARAQKESLRSEEHTSELQSRGHLVCRLLLE